VNVYSTTKTMAATSILVAVDRGLLDLDAPVATYLAGIRLLREESVDRLLEEHTRGTDKVLGVPVRFGMGFGLVDKNFPLSPNERAFFSGGWGARSPWSTSTLGSPSPTS
jgi:hypothetical protein